MRIRNGIENYIRAESSRTDPFYRAEQHSETLNDVGAYPMHLQYGVKVYLSTSYIS